MSLDLLQPADQADPADTFDFVQLGDLVEVLDHKRVPVNRKEREQREGDFPYFGATGQVGWIDDYLFDESLVLLGEDGISFLDPFAQKAYVVVGKSWVNNHAHVLRPRPGVVDLTYLCHALNGIDYAGMVNGTTRLKLTKSAMLRLRVPVPTYVQQQLIAATLAEHLGRVAVGQDNFARAKVGIAQFRAACLGAAFAGTLVGDTQPTIRPLDELAVIQSGVAKGRPTAEMVHEAPYIRTANVQAGYLDLSDIKSIDVTAAQLHKHQLRNEDVLVLEGGDADKVGRGWLWEGQVEGCLHQNHVFAVRTERSALEPRFLAYFLNSPQARRYFGSCAKQTTNLASINKAQLRALPVPVVSVAEQRLIVAELDRDFAAAREQERQLQEHLRKAAHLKRSLLDAALAGRLTPTTTVLP